MEKHQCCVRVWSDWRGHPCRNKAIMEVDGKWYCGVHNPIKKAERDAKATMEFESKMLACRVEAIARRACFEINPDNPQAVAESIKDMHEACKAITQWCDDPEMEVADIKYLVGNALFKTKGIIPLKED